MDRIIARLEAQLEAEGDPDIATKRARLYGQLLDTRRKQEAHEQKGREVYTPESAREWLLSLPATERQALVREWAKLDGQKGSGLA
jgi:hypothetical protein